MEILKCPCCGFNSCPIFYGFGLVLPNFDKPKEYKIELKFICYNKNNKIQSIDLGQYLKIIELNKKYNNNLKEEKNNIDNKIMDYNNIKNELSKIDIKDIINKYKDIVSTNEKEINIYLNKEKNCSKLNKFILKRYIELNNQLYHFMDIFFKIINEYETNNLLASFYYISKNLNSFKELENNNSFVQKKLIYDFILSNDITKLPFLIKLPNIYLSSKESEILEGHTLPIVGLTQMRNGLLLSGSCGMLKIWKKIDDINDEKYKKFHIFHTVLNKHHLVRCFIELEDDIVIFCRGNQIIEALINDKDIYKELFIYNVVGNCLESLVAINNNNNFAAGVYTKLYIFERKKKFPIYTLQYHRLFIMKMISLSQLNLFCSSGTDNKVIVYNSTTFELHMSFEFEESHIVSLCNYNDTEFCASTMGGKIWYFKRNEIDNTFEKIGPINAHTREIYGILQIKNGEVVSVSRDDTIKFWNIPKKICVCIISLNNRNTFDHICQLDDGRLCFASNNHIIKIFNNLPFCNKKLPFYS